MTDGVGLRSERGPILLALMLATFLIAIDATILATAVPTIVREFGGFDQFPWLFSVYLLAQAATVPVYSKLSDTIGRKPVIALGILLFLAGSILCALAWDMTSLIAFRAVQGLGAGAITPVVMTIAGDIYSVRERARAQGYIASMWAISSVAGPTLGGLFSQFVSWRWIFWINVPLSLIALVILLRNYRESFQRVPRRIDYAGATLLTTALVLVVLGTLEGGQAWAWLSWQSIACFALGFVLLAAFVLVERRADDPVLAPWVLSNRPVVVSAVIGLGVGVVLLGLTSYVPTFLESTAGAVPLVSGLAVAALTLGWPVSASYAGRLFLRIGFRATIVIGGAISVVGAVGAAAAVLAPSVWLMGAACFVIGLGLGLVASPSLIATQSSVDKTRRGVVSGTNMLARSVGSAVGVAVFGAIANAVIAGRGGPDDPGAIQAGAFAVFIGVAATTVLMLVACAAFPHVAIADEPPADDTEADGTTADGTAADAGSDAAEETDAEASVPAPVAPPTDAAAEVAETTPTRAP